MAYLARIIPHIQTTRAVENMRQSLQSMVLAEAIALEVFAGDQITLVIRAKSAQGLAHALQQIRSHYPHVVIEELTSDQDYLVMAEGEAVRGTQLVPQGDPYLSLQIWDPEHTAVKLGSMGNDPLLGILQALNTPPEGTRVVASLVIAKAPERWSKGHIYAADQHSIQQVRRLDGQGSEDAGAPSLGLVLILLGAILTGFLWEGIYQHIPISSQHAIMRDIGNLFHGRPWEWGPALPFIVCVLVEGLMFVGVYLLFRAVGRLRRKPVYDQQAIMEKAGMTAYRTRLSLYMLGRPDRLQSDAAAAYYARVLQAYHVADNPNGLYFQDRPQRQVVPAQWDEGMRHVTAVLSVHELASLWHIPADEDQPTIPFLNYHVGPRGIMAPRDLQCVAGDPMQIGYSEHGGRRVPIRLTADQLSRHMLLVAKTGKGKSTLLKRIAQLTLNDPSWGLIMIDPHGDMAGDMVQLIPAHRASEVLYVNLGDTEYPIPINPLDMSSGADRDQIAETILEIFSQYWAQSWGSRMEDAFSYALKTMMAVNEALVRGGQPQAQLTFLDLGPMLLNESYRTTLLGLVTEPHILSWWNTYFKGLYANMRTDVINPVLTKMDRFTGSQTARNIVGLPRTGFQFETVVANGGIFIMNCGMGKVGESTATLLATMMLGLGTSALSKQSSLAREQRRKFLVIVDEFQTMSGVNFGSMLAELRKYGATFVLATQALSYLDKLDPTLRATVLSNVDTIFGYGMSADDARLMEKELDGILLTDLINVPPYHCYIKTTHGPKRLPTFYAAVSDVQGHSQEVADQIIERSRERAIPRLAAEDQVYQLEIRHHMDKQASTAMADAARRKAMEQLGRIGVVGGALDPSALTRADPNAPISMPMAAEVDRVAPPVKVHPERISDETVSTSPPLATDQPVPPRIREMAIWEDSDE